jgi:hypothetical protein
MPMRFGGAGGIVDVYQAATHVDDTWETVGGTFFGREYERFITSLLDGAINDGFYGAFTTNMHMDGESYCTLFPHPGSDTVVDEAKARGVPVVSAHQMLEWLDGRNASAFDHTTWDALSGTLQFETVVAPGARGLYAMLPTSIAGRTLSTISRGGTGVTFTTEVIKGVQYGFFPAAPLGETGVFSYVATYVP